MNSSEAKLPYPLSHPIPEDFQFGSERHLHHVCCNYSSLPGKGCRQCASIAQTEKEREESGACERCDGVCTGACAKGAMWWPDDEMPPGPLADALADAAQGRTDRDASLMRQAAAFINAKIEADTKVYRRLFLNED